MADEVPERVHGFGAKRSKLEKATDSASSGGVKEAVFLPSGRRVLSVLGTLGDEFIDPAKPYCSCSHFFFRVRTSNDDTCYHLMSFRLAEKAGSIDRIEFSDEEYEGYVRVLASDVFSVIDRSSTA